MVADDPQGYIRVRRLNRRRPGERRLSERRAPGADEPAIGQPGTDTFEGDQIHSALRVSDASEFAIRVYAHQIRSDRDRARFEEEATALKALIGERYVVAI